MRGCFDRIRPTDKQMLLGTGVSFSQDGLHLNLLRYQCEMISRTSYFYLILSLFVRQSVSIEQEKTLVLWRTVPQYLILTLLSIYCRTQKSP